MIAAQFSSERKEWVFYCLHFRPHVLSGGLIFNFFRYSGRPSCYTRSLWTEAEKEQFVACQKKKKKKKNSPPSPPPRCYGEIEEYWAAEEHEKNWGLRALEAREAENIIMGPSSRRQGVSSLRSLSPTPSAIHTSISLFSFFV